MRVMSGGRGRLGVILLCEKNICSLVSRFTRRSSTCCSTIPPESNQEKKNTLLLCFSRYKRSAEIDGRRETSMTNIVRPIKLDSYNDDEVEECEDEIVGQSYPDNSRWGWVTRFGSKILFQNYNVGHISWIDPTTRLREFNTGTTRIPSLSSRVGSFLHWGEIDRNLYCIYTGYDDYCDKFEVLESDPENNVAKWRPLLPPPCFGLECLFLNRSKIILGWRNGECGVYIYDVTAPEKGWTESNQSSLRDALPFLIRSRQYFVIDDLHHPGLGNFKLVFNLKYHDERRADEPAVVYLFLLSENCDSFQIINDPIYLPQELSIRDIGFVNLGDQKLGIVVHEDSAESETSVVLTYKYDLIVSSSNVLEIKTRLLGTRRFRFPRARDDDYWCLTRIVGAYLL